MGCTGRRPGATSARPHGGRGEPARGGGASPSHRRQPLRGLGRGRGRSRRPRSHRAENARQQEKGGRTTRARRGGGLPDGLRRDRPRPVRLTTGPRRRGIGRLHATTHTRSAGDAQPGTAHGRADIADARRHCGHGSSRRPEVRRAGGWARRRDPAAQANGLPTRAPMEPRLRSPYLGHGPQVARRAGKGLVPRRRQRAPAPHPVRRGRRHEHRRAQRHRAPHGAGQRAGIHCTPRAGAVPGEDRVRAHVGRGAGQDGGPV